MKVRTVALDGHAGFTEYLKEQMRQLVVETVIDAQQ